MSEFIFHAQLWLPGERERIFSFFAKAENLKVITPPWLHLKLTTPEPILMRAGTLIDYLVRIYGIPIQWRTEIAEWNPTSGFVDVQVKGPYLLWRHSHTFEESNGGTLCRDDVNYRPRGGAFLNWLFVRRDLQRIFDFRNEQLRRIFNPSQQ